MANWVELPRDCLISIAERLKLLEDYVSFGAVCNTWRAAATKKYFKGISLWQGRPCLMLAENTDSNYREFYSLFEDRIVTKLFLPEIKGKKCMEASFGWFLTIGDEGGETCLLNPFTRDQIHLPHPNATDDFEYQETEYPIFYQKALLSSAPCQNPQQDFVLMVIDGGQSFLSFWRPGDRFWTRITTYYGAHDDLAYYKGQFYAITGNGKVLVCDIGGASPRESKIVASIPSDFPYLYEYYIMESLGRLLVVARHGIHSLPLAGLPDGYSAYEIERDYESFPQSYGTNQFRVFEVDLVNHKCIEIQDLGDRAIFVGHSASLCIDQASKFPEVKANHIYFTDDFPESYLRAEGGGGRDMGIYNFSDGSISSHYKGQSVSLIGPPVWLMPCSSCMAVYES